MGFEIAIYGISLLMHTVRTMQDVLGKLAQGDVSFIGKGVGFEEYKTIVGFEDWAAIEDRYLKPKSSAATSGGLRPLPRRQWRRWLPDRPGNPPRSRPPLPHAMPRPAPAPACMPRLMKSAALSGNTGAAQCSGSVASARQA